MIPDDSSTVSESIGKILYTSVKDLYMFLNLQTHINYRFTYIHDGEKIYVGHLVWKI